MIAVTLTAPSEMRDEDIKESDEQCDTFQRVYFRQRDKGKAKVSEDAGGEKKALRKLETKEAKPLLGVEGFELLEGSKAEE